MIVPTPKPKPKPEAQAWERYCNAFYETNRDRT